MEVLPAELMIDIFSRLSVKTIILCKFVCKKWRNLILDSSFVDLHLSRSPTGLIIHHLPDHIGSKYQRILQWVQVEDKVDHHLLFHDPPMSLHLHLPRFLENTWIRQVGSVNGLICLCQYSSKLDNTLICNPITRECMILPRSFKTSINYGFGVVSLTREYKVVRTFKGDSSVLEAEIYTLGTRKWRSLGHVPYRLNGSYGPFLNDHCHWIVSNEEDTPEKLYAFDLDRETFQLFPSPPTETIQGYKSYHQSLAVLKGCLCKIDTYISYFTIWVMKEYGIKKSWHKEVVINYETGGWPGAPMSLIECLKDGSILAVSEHKLWEFYPWSETIEDTEMFKHTKSGLTYRPSFLKLENFKSEIVLKDSF